MSNDDHLHSIIADYGDACAEMQAELAAMKRADLEAQLTERLELIQERAVSRDLRKRYDDAVEAIDLKDKELIQERAVARDLRKRVGELENKNSYNLQIVREATARIAELEAELSRDGDQIVKAFRERYDRAERAERAEAERDALHLFSGAQAAVIKEMREALELVLKYEYDWLPTSLADAARAALRSLTPTLPGGRGR